MKLRKHLNKEWTTKPIFPPQFSFYFFPLTNISNNCNNGVFTGVFTCQRVACEDAGRAAYGQLRLHVTGEYNHRKLVSVVKPQNMLHASQFTHSEFTRTCACACKS